MIKMQEDIYRVLNQITDFIYEHYQEDIQDAHELFWEEERPEELLHGMLLDIGELNFDDWLTIDYRNPYGESFIELYEKYSEPDVDKDIINALKESRISLYEVEGVEDGRIKLRDLLRNTVFYPDWQLPDSQLKTGDLFATRFIRLNERFFMGKCIYPFHSTLKEEILRYLDMQYNRYLKNENPNGDIESFLKDASSVFNTIWITFVAGRG
ncbi:MAG: hypothetical protein N2257_07110 [Thermodesulfovibrionales bacterium]|nr:hypothetical protein [Thermodesulfovibrionales bacterium]